MFILIADEWGERKLILEGEEKEEKMENTRSQSHLMDPHAGSSARCCRGLSWCSGILPAGRTLKRARGTPRGAEATTAAFPPLSGRHGLLLLLLLLIYRYQQTLLPHQQ